MIHIFFEGGLGNQMFQYAFTRYLQIKFNEGVEYDISKYEFEKNETREFDLNAFNISRDWICAPKKKSRFERFGAKYVLYLIITFPYIKINKALLKRGHAVWFSALYQRLINCLGFYRVHFYDYAEPKYTQRKNKYIRGQWFCPSIVMKIDDYIRNELKVITPISALNQSFLAKIHSCNSVGVHIRRGDYVELGLIVCSIPYYEKCMKRMASLAENPVFFIFSDDIDWVRENLNVDYPVVYIDNKNSSVDDMRLFYSCNHFILSNSTFSWWGAYLGGTDDKIVIAPKYWHGGKENFLVCPNWLLEDNSKQ